MVDLLADDGLLNMGKRATTDPLLAVREIQAEREELPAVNEDLANWSPPEGPRQCHLCDEPHQMTCRNCSQGACSKHSWMMLGLCHSCSQRPW